MKSRPHIFAAFLLLASATCFADDGSVPKVPLPAGDSVPGVTYVATLQNGFSIRFDHRTQTSDGSRLFLDAAGTGFIDVHASDIAGIVEEKVPPRTVPPPQPAPMNIPEAVAAASDKHGIDADLLYSVIRAESGFNPRAVSRKGAQGLMQLMPATAGQLGVQDVFDTASNVEAGTRYLRELLDRYHYDLAIALAAYNAGPECVDRYRGVPPYRETRAYVARIIREYNRKKRAAMKSARGASSSPRAAARLESGS